MKILFAGDIVGSPGRKAVAALIPQLKKREKAEFVIANGENAAGGSGVTPRIAEELFNSGVDIITSGDHIWKRREIIEILDQRPNILRPANYPPGAPGLGSHVVRSKKGNLVGVINLVGRVFMEALDCPFRKAREEIETIKKETKVIIVDIHAEATSEKIAMGWYLDGLVSAVVGTHTHVQTADERILPQGTAYITDVGMTGPHDSVIGRRKEQILARFITQLPTRFEMAEEDVQLNGVVLEIDEKTGKAGSIKRLQEKLK
ncbi:MAG: TIGR00282 family metallophosphoesterase [Candidatus Omnitrophica bacterium]|nr:TIGR00282 family metallophosphoesterase [Candidatus Omnitrophota bacterium]